MFSDVSFVRVVFVIVSSTRVRRRRGAMVAWADLTRETRPDAGRRSLPSAVLVHAAKIKKKVNYLPCAAVSGVEAGTWKPVRTELSRKACTPAYSYNLEPRPE